MQIEDFFDGLEELCNMVHMASLDNLIDTILENMGVLNPHAKQWENKYLLAQLAFCKRNK